MFEYLEDFITEDEKAQLKVLEERAMMRKERKEDAACKIKQSRYLLCQCECRNEMEEDDKEEGKKRAGKGGASEIEQLLREICRFSMKHDICQCPYHRAVRLEREWEGKREREEREYEEMLFSGELPF